MTRRIYWTLLLSAIAAHALAAGEPVIGGPCEGCENVFVDQPAELASTARIAGADEPGEALVIEGTVRTPDGEPAPGIIVYAYQTNKDGVYPRGATRHGALRGWAKTDAEGNYRFDTIRPGAYPRMRIPQHVHMHVIEPDKATYYIGDINFGDDPYLSDGARSRHERARGGSGLLSPNKDADGVWHVRRDIVLGKNVPGYDDASE